MLVFDVTRGGAPAFLYALRGARDVDVAVREALIEEVQIDWPRFAGKEVEALRAGQPRSREL